MSINRGLQLDQLPFADARLSSAYTTQQVILEVEVDIFSVLLDDLENFDCLGGDLVQLSIFVAVREPACSIIVDLPRVRRNRPQRRQY
jgi:hypothetical protein